MNPMRQASFSSHPRSFAGSVFGALVAATIAISSAGAAPTAPPTDAAPAVVEAQTRFRRALELYEEGNLDAARAELRRAYETSPSYKVLYNLAQVEFELHDYPAALASFEQYLMLGGDKVPEARKAQVQTDIEKLRARVATVRITVNVAGAQVLIDDVASGNAPLAGPIVVSAGRRKVVVTSSGYRAETRLVDLGGGDQARLDFTLQEAMTPQTRTLTRQVGPELAAVTTESRARHRKPVPWAAWGLTGVLAAGAAATGIASLVNSKQLQRERDRFGVQRTELDRLQRQVNGFALASDICTGAAIVGAGVSLFLTVSRGDEDRPERTLRVVPGPGSLQIAGSF
jgi:PEGA domain